MFRYCICTCHFCARNTWYLSVLCSSHTFVPFVYFSHSPAASSTGAAETLWICICLRLSKGFILARMKDFPQICWFLHCFGKYLDKYQVYPRYIVIWLCPIQIQISWQVQISWQISRRPEGRGVYWLVGLSGRISIGSGGTCNPTHWIRHLHGHLHHHLS